MGQTNEKTNVGGSVDAETAKEFENNLPDGTSKSHVIEQKLAEFSREHGHLINPRRAMGASLLICWSLFIIAILSTWAGFVVPAVGALAIEMTAGVLGLCGVAYATVDYYIRNGLPFVE